MMIISVVYIRDYEAVKLSLGLLSNAMHINFSSHPFTQYYTQYAHLLFLSLTTT